MTTGLVVRGESGRPAPLFPLFLCLVLAACATVQPELPSGRAPRPAEVRPSTFRSALDGRPRMLTTDLGGDLWVAYDTGNAALYKVWPGGVVLEGAVYDYRHGPQPRAIGPAWVLRSGRNPWRLRKAGESIRPEVQYRGHREEEGAIVILAELRHEDLVIPVEERVRRSPDPVPSVEWRFRTSGVPADVMVEVLVELDSLQAMPETDGRWRDRREGTDEALRASLVLTSNAETTMLVRFADPVVSAVASPEVDAVWEAMAATGCPSCHATEAQTVGPSLLAIAERYDDDSRTIDRLAQEVRHGSQGVWGEKAMPAQDFVSLAQARDFVAFILALDAEGAEDANDAHAQRAAAELRTNREPTQWEMAVEFGPGFVSNWIAESIVELVEPEPEASGDGAPVPGVHPSFDLEEIRLEEFQPKVGGMDFFSNGDLVIASWDEVGAVYRVSGLQGNDPRDIRVKRIAWGLAEPLGLRVVDDRIYVLQKHELTELIDHDRDGDTDEYRTVSNDWEVSGNFHEFAFGLVADEEGFLITLASSVMPGGYSAPSQPVDRGAVLRIAPDGRAHRVARGLRTPNGIGAGVDGEIFVADNQGCWLPASKIVHLQPDAFYGFRDVDPEADAALVETPPVVWLPQDEIGNSPHRAGSPERRTLPRPDDPRRCDPWRHQAGLRRTGRWCVPGGGFPLQSGTRGGGEPASLGPRRQALRRWNRQPG